MMKFDVKYRFSHTLMYCLREEGALGEELERSSITVTCSAPPIAYSLACPCTQCLSHTRTPVDMHTLH